MQHASKDPAKLGTIVLSRRNLVWIATGVVAGCLGIVAASSFQRSTPEGGPAFAGTFDGHGITLPTNAPEWKLVKRGKATPLTDRLSDPFPGRFKVDEARVSRVGAPLAGRVVDVFVEVGQQVKAGDPLVAVTSSDVAELRSERQKAAVDLEVLRAKERRVAAMLEARAVSESDLINVQHDVKQAELAVELADTKLASLRVSASGHNAFTVTAPRDGVVIEKNVLPGQQVSTDGTLFSVADLSTVWVVAELFEADATAAIGTGTSAHITSPSLPGLVLDAPIEQVSSVANPGRHTISVRVPIANPDRSIRPNAYCEVQFRLPAPAGSVDIAASAVVTEGDKQYVYVEQSPGRLVRREIVAGAVRNGRVEVLRGLAAGETVIEEGSALIDNQIALAT